MPTYVYRCKKGHTFELFHAISDDTPKRCPKCRSGATRVPSGGSGLLFKGSGFYITDYRSSGYKESAKQDSGGKSDKSSGTTPGSSGSSGGSSSSSSAAPKGGSEKPSSKPDRSSGSSRKPDK
jgi:putative FmdB family regulatory protein